MDRKQDYPLGFRLANKIYKRNFFLYRSLYFAYKQISERQAIDFARKHIRPGMTVLDIGGNIGFYTVLFSRLAGDGGQVHVFEPEPRNFNHLEACAGTCNNVTLNNMAVGDKTGKIRLYLSDDLNVDHQTYDIGEGRSWVKAKCISIDDYLGSTGSVDFIKIDVQGYDYHAILGMQKTIARSGQVTLMGELWPYALKKAGVDPPEYLNLLREMGFGLRVPDNETIKNKINDKLFYTNFFAFKGSGDESS